MIYRLGHYHNFYSIYILFNQVYNFVYVNKFAIHIFSVWTERETFLLQWVFAGAYRADRDAAIIITNCNLIAPSSRLGARRGTSVSEPQQRETRVVKYLDGGSNFAMENAVIGRRKKITEKKLNVSNKRKPRY